MLTLDQFAAMDAREQVARWPGVHPNDRPRYLDRAQPIAQIVIKTPVSRDVNTATNRSKIKEALKRIGTHVEVGDDEWLTRYIDISQRIETAKRNWDQGLDPDIRDQWPAYRLINPTGPMPAGVEERWIAAGGRVINGEMMALKTDAVWQRFSEFGLAHPPYDLAGVLDIEDVESDDAQLLQK